VSLLAKSPTAPGITEPFPAGHQRSQGRRLPTDEPSSLLLLPALIIFAVFVILPLAVALYLSFTRWDAISDPTWTGLDNWVRILASDNFANGLVLSIKVVVISWLVQTPISLLIGVFIAGKQKYRAVLATLFFLPIILSSAAVALAFKSILDPNFGLGASLGLPWLQQDWLGDPQLIFVVVIFIIAW